VNQNVTTLTPGGQPLGVSLGFDARSVLVDNYTSSYVQLTDAGRTIPPWVYGAVVALPPGVRQANAKLLTTTPAPAGPPVPTIVATLTWTDEPLPDSAGHLMAQSQYQLQQVLATITTPGDSAAHTQSVSLPPGTQAVGYVVQFSGFFAAGVVSITGDQSGRTWLVNSAINTAPLDFQAAPVVAALDTSVTCSVTDLGLPCRVTFVAYLSNPTSFVLPSYDQGAIPIPVTPEPQYWMVPFSFVEAEPLVAAGGIATIVAAVTGDVVNFFRWHQWAVSNPATQKLRIVRFSNGSGLLYGLPAVPTSGQPLTIDMDGEELPVGSGVYLANIGAGASDFNVILLTYSGPHA
jgi:hypothetical protein